MYISKLSKYLHIHVLADELLDAAAGQEGQGAEQGERGRARGVAGRSAHAQLGQQPPEEEHQRQGGQEVRHRHRHPQPRHCCAGHVQQQRLKTIFLHNNSILFCAIHSTIGPLVPMSTLNCTLRC